VKVHETPIHGVTILEPAVHRDERGFLSEVFNESSLKQAGIDDHFVQENHTLSKLTGTVRGLHFQIPPHPAAKLVRCTRGSIFDVAVDLRRNSSTYGRHVSVTLSAGNWLQVYVPRGFAHGFCTLEHGTEVVYKTTSFWSPEADRGVRWDDPDLGISWPVSSEDAVLSEKDAEQPLFADLETFFD